MAGIGGLTFANDRAALSLAPGPQGMRLGLFPTSTIGGQLTVTLPGDEPGTSDVRTLDVQLSPDRPFVQDLPLATAAPSQGEVHVTLVDAGGETVFDWQGAAQLR